MKNVFATELDQPEPTRMNNSQSSLDPKFPRVCLGILIGAVVFVMSAKVHAICGLDGAAQELIRNVKNPDALRELNRQLLPIGRFSESCKVCHVAGPGGPRNGFGSAVNTLLTLSDREDPVRQRDVGRRMTDIPSNPTVLDSPTFGELFQRGELPETIFTPQDREVDPSERVPETETLTVESARERVRQAMAESRFGILQLSKVQEISPEVAEELAKFEGETLILGIRSLTPWVAEELAKSRAANVWLHSVTSVFPDSGEVIAQLPGELVMTGLSRLDSVPLAEKLVRRPGALSFPFLEEISPEIAAVLAKEERSLTLAGLASPSPEVQEKLSGTAGALYLPYLKTLDSMPLTEKLASGLLVLPRIEKLSGEQAKVFASIKGADSFFGGYFFPLEAMTPEVADVIAESWERVRLTLVGKEIPSDEVLRTLKKSRIGIVLRDVEEVTAEQARIIAESEGASINLPGLKRLDSALLAEKFQGLFPSVTSISPEAAAVLGKLPDSVRTLRDGTVDVRPSGDLFLPSLKELPTETARLLLKKRWLSISLPVLEDVSLATLQSLARQTFRLTLGIPALPPEFADAFAETPTDSTMGGGYILLPNVSDLSPEAARILVKSLNRGVEDLGHTRISKSPKLYFGGGLPLLRRRISLPLSGSGRGTGEVRGVSRDSRPRRTAGRIRRRTSVVPGAVSGPDRAGDAEHLARGRPVARESPWSFAD